MDYKKPYVRAVFWCVISALLTAAINIACLALRGDENHYWMLLVNLISDWLCGVFLVYFISCYVQPRKELYRLSCKRREEIWGVVDKVELQPVRYERINCVTVHMGERQLFAPEGISLPKEGESAGFSVAGNVILEVLA